MDRNTSTKIIDLIARLKKLQITVQLFNDQLKINAPKGALNPSLLTELKERKEEIIDFLKSTQTHAKANYASIEPVEKKDYYILSPAQKRIFILQQMEAESTSYNMPMVIPLAEDLDLQRLENAFRALIARHESLRTSFTVIENEPVQRIHNEVEFKIEYDSGADQHGMTQTFDLSRAPLLRVALRGIKQSKPRLFVDIHHIINDGVSHNILTRELMELYAGKELPPLKLQYKDYAEWQNNDAQQEQVKQQEIYWQEQFSGELPVLSLPLDFPRPVVQSFEGHSAKFVLTEKEVPGLKRFASEIDGTLYIVIFSIFTILLSRLSGQEDIIIGTPTAGRRHADLEMIIGMFVNTLALRNYLGGSKPFNDFLQEVKVRTLKAFENQEYPFEKLVEKVAVNRDTGRNPVFDVMFAWQSMAEIPGVKDQTDDINDSYEDNVAKFDLTLVALETVNGIFFELSYCCKLFKAETIDRFIIYFKNIVNSILENPTQQICELEMLSEKEKQQLLVEFNDTGAPYPNDKTIPQLFQEQVAKTPDHIAVIQPVQSGLPVQPVPTVSPVRHVRLTYLELNEQSDHLAALLIEKGVEPGASVGLMVNRSNSMLIGILGILKTGCAYVPLNPKAPGARSEYMLEESRAGMLVSTTNLSEKSNRMGTWQGKIVIIDDFLGGSQLPIFSSSYLPGPANFAYIIFTSGSTGKPKGVAITHANLSPLLHWGYRHLGLGTKDRFLQNLSYYFDWSAWEMMIALTTGASLYMVSDELLMNPEESVAFMDLNKITVLHVTPTQYQYYLKAPGRPWTLKYLFIGAEKFSRELMQQSIESVQEGCRIFNMYGPTECTIISAVLEIGRTNVEKFRYLSSVPIGKAVGNIDLYVLDKYWHLCPVNVWGELYISGDCVAWGYLNNPELTINRFKLLNKSFYRGARGAVFSKIAPLVYRTGDLARRLADGNVEFLGRIDQQVKIRGFRIELGEIESELLKHHLIKEAVVIDIERENGEPYLGAYIVEKEKFDLGVLKDYLAGSLPDYMVPSYFMRIPAVPLNPNGKLDRGALPVLEIKAGPRAEETYMSPANEIEEQLVTLWAEVLDVEKDKISMTDNFFDLGGHSLKATVLSAKIHKAFGLKIPLVELFRLPTVRESAQYIVDNVVAAENKYKAVEPVEKKEYYPLSSAQRRLYILQRMTPQGTVYNMTQFQPLSTTIDKDRLRETFKQLIQRHESLRTSFIEVNEEPVQKVHDEVEFEIESPIGSPFIRPFDLSCAPLLRVGVAEGGEGGEGKYLLMVDLHHIISDGVSQEILLKEFLAIYNGISLPRPRLQYKDFAEWQNKPAQREALKKQEQYWLTSLEGELPVLDLPYDYARPEVQSFTGSHMGFYLDDQETGALKSLAVREDVTLYMALLAVFNVLTARLSGQEDIIIGVPTAGRSHADIQQIIGMFVNTLAVRNYPTTEKTILSFLKEVKTNALGAFENQDYPFEDLVEKLTVVRDVSRNPVFDLVFVLQNLAGASGVPGEKTAADPAGLTTANEYESKIAKFDMTLFAVERGENLTFLLEYCTRLFKEDTISRFAGYFKNIVNSIAANPHQQIASIEMISAEEKQQLLVEFNDTGTPYPSGKTISHLFQEQVVKTPAHIAIVGSGSRVCPSISLLPVQPVPHVRPVQLTYLELHEQSSCLASHLKEKCVKPDNIVGIMLERSLEMIIGIFGILKAGGAYLPIDPGYPQERVEYMLKDSNAKILINKSDFLKGYPRRGLSNFEFRASDLNPSNLAYVIYTSGSTGMPKGVLIEHNAVVNRLNWMQKVYPLDCNDVILQKTAFTFDVSVWELFWWSFYGASVRLLGPGEEKDPAAIVEAVIKHRVTTVHFVPSMLTIFLGCLESEIGAQLITKMPSLRQVFASGEALGPMHVERFYHLFGRDGETAAKLINLYGPTEATVDVSYFNCIPSQKYERIPIGKPIHNISLYVLGKNFHLQPVGVVGELYIGGVGLGRGYLNRPELTIERFIDFHHSSFDIPRIHHSNLYRTGDLARWLKDGNIEYLGRIDHQVKVRGFRIELGEIENRLLAEPVVKEAVVVARADRSGDAGLAAYVVPDKAAAFTVHRLLEIEQNKLYGDRVYYELPNGMPVFYLNRNEADFMYREIFEECSYLRHGITLKKGSCIFDIGANIGMFSLFAHYFCPGGSIYSFEPAPPLYDLLALNTSLYDGNFKIFKNGISSQEEEVVFTYYPHASILSGRFANDAEEKETVKAFIHHELAAAESDGRDRLTEEQIDELLTERISGVKYNCAMKTVSQVMRENCVEQIDLLKIDVEKAELDVLQGIAAEDWPKIRQIVIEVHDSEGRLAKIMDLLDKQGYEMAVEQDSMLAETALYNLYAIKKGKRGQAKKEQEKQVESTAELKRGQAKNQYIHFSPGRLIDDLRQSLKGRLPDYMVPSHFVLLVQMPLTGSGKVDRKALPAPDVKRGEGYEAPCDEIEEKLVSIWSEILNIGQENISVTARFFDLGGHSLKATAMAARIYREFAVQMPLVQVFNTPTIRGLAGYLKNVGNETAVMEDTQLVRLKKSSVTNPKHLFLVHDGSGEVEGYVEFCRQLELDIDCWGIRAEKLAGYAPDNLSIAAMVGNYIEKIKTLQPHGPYHIAGWSLGGTIAFEMAYQLEANNETIAFLGLFDSPGPMSVPDSMAAEKFTPESEVAWLKDYLPNKQLIERLKNISAINKIWAEVIIYLEENQYSIEKVRQLIPSYLAQIIPGFEQLSLQELIYYLNLGRSLTRARAVYIPKGKIQAKIHHFRASESLEISQGTWAEYCLSLMKVYPVSGSHYSILKMPAAAQMAQLFRNLLS